jgi:NAD+ diphosphatase
MKPPCKTENYGVFMLEDIAPHRLDIGYGPKRKPAPDSLVLAARGNFILCALEGGAVRLPRLDELDSAQQRQEFWHLLNLDDTGIFMPQGTLTARAPYSWQPHQVLRGGNPQELCFAAYTARQLSLWYQDHRFCGRCAHELERSSQERALECPKCGAVVYPKICPAVIAAVTDGERIVVTRYHDRPYRGLALIAGFCEIGESPEDTVRREVMEEVGLKVRDIRYVGSQPWGADSDLLLGFVCTLDGSDRIVRQEDELSEALWAQRSELPDGGGLSLTRTMIGLFKAGKLVPGALARA